MIFGRAELPVGSPGQDPSGQAKGRDLPPRGRRAMVDLSPALGDPESEDFYEDYWVVCLQEVAGCPAILRLISGVPESIAMESYTDRVTIAWRYSPEDDGLPSDADSAQMDFFEDVLVESVEAQMNACLAIVTTAKGTKEWVLYSSAPDEVVGFIERLVQQNDLPIELRRDKDPNWQEYRRLMETAEAE